MVERRPRSMDAVQKSTAIFFEIFTFFHKSDLIARQHLSRRFYVSVLPQIFHSIRLSQPVSYYFTRVCDKPSNAREPEELIKLNYIKLHTNYHLETPEVEEVSVP